MADFLYQGHGSFRLVSDAGCVIYIDPFAGEGYDRPADLVLVSHEHGDHNQVQLVALKPDGKILRAKDFISQDKDGTIHYQKIQQQDVQIQAVAAYNRNHPRIPVWVLLLQQVQRSCILPVIPPRPKKCRNLQKNSLTMPFCRSTASIIWMHSKQRDAPKSLGQSRMYRYI